MKNVPVDKEIRFIAFGAEKIGLVGSKYYVSLLSQDEISRSIVNYNLDMVWTNWEPASQLFDYEPMKLSVVMPFHSYHFFSGNRLDQR